jgi:hypothetical protein
MYLPVYLIYPNHDMVPQIFDHGNFDRHNDPHIDPHIDHHTVHHMGHHVEGQVVVEVVVAVVATLGTLSQMACSLDDDKASLNEGKGVVEGDWNKGHVDNSEEEEVEVEVAAGLHRKNHCHSLEVQDQPPMQQQVLLSDLHWQLNFDAIEKEDLQDVWI